MAARDERGEEEEEDALGRFSALKEQGGSPREVDAAARQEGMGGIERIRLLRRLFDLSLMDAKAVAGGLPVVPGPAPVESYGQLREALTRELGYCPCAGDDAVPLLADVLRLARDRGEAAGDDPAAFARASRALEARLGLDAAPALASWFVYGLEQRDLIWHGFRVTDVWITDKGRALLAALESLHPQAQGDAAIEARLQREAPPEALSWLQEEPGRRYRSVSGLEPPDALALVRSLYQAGAPRVLALDIAVDADEQGGEPFAHAGTLVIELPERRAQDARAQDARARVLATCAAFARRDEAGVPDRGRRYVLLWWNSGRPVVCS